MADNFQTLLNSGVEKKKVRIIEQSEHSLWSRLSLGFIDPIVVLSSSKSPTSLLEEKEKQSGFEERKIELGDLWLPGKDLLCEHSWKQFDAAWSEETKKLKKNLSSPSSQHHSTTSPSPLPSIVRTIGSVVWPYLFVSIFLRLSISLLIPFRVHFTEKLFSYLYSPPSFLEIDSLLPGINCGLGLTSCILLDVFFSAHYHKMMGFMNVKIRGMLSMAIFRKTLRLSTTANGGVSKGEVITLLSADPEKVQELFRMPPNIAANLIDLILYIVLLFRLLGVAGLGAILIILIIGPFNAAACKKFLNLRKEIMQHQQRRMEILSEVIESVLAVKMFGWELLCRDRIDAIRSLEMRAVKWLNYAGALATSVVKSTEVLFTLLCFSIYLLLGNELTPEVIFPSIYIFQSIMNPVQNLPWYASVLSQALASTQRVEDFFSLPEMEKRYLEDTSSSFSSPNGTEPEEGSISIEGAYGYTITEPSSSEENKTELSQNHLSPSSSSSSSSSKHISAANIKLEVQPGTMVAIIGQVGAGKTSLIGALLGEVEKLNPEKEKDNTASPLSAPSQSTSKSRRRPICGTIAYVPQTPWIRNDTLRANITMCDEHEIDHEAYRSALCCCALNTDIEELEGGDLAEIGERGYNLSGGQKQRVSLARAVYANKDVYLLDDPLSAVDTKVGRHLFEECLCQELAGKTRILVTHQWHYLSDCHEVSTIYLMSQGRLVCSGSLPDIVQFLSGGVPRGIGEVNEKESDYLDAVVGSSEKNLPAPSSPYFALSHSSLLTLSSSVDECLDSSGVCQVSEEERRKSGQITKEDEISTRSVSIQTYIEYGMLNGKVALISFLLLSFLYVGCEIGIYAWIAKFASPSSPSPSPASSDSDSFGHVERFLFWFIIFSLTYTLVCFLRNFAYYSSTAKASKRLHDNMFWGVLRAPMSFHQSTPNGRLISRFGADIHSVDTGIPDQLNDLLSAAIFVGSCVGVICLFNPPFLLFVPPIFFLFRWVYQWFVGAARSLVLLTSVSTSPIFAHYSEVVDGLASLRTYQLCEKEIQKHATLFDIKSSADAMRCCVDLWGSMRISMLSGAIVFVACLLASLHTSGFLFSSVPTSLIALSVTLALKFTNALRYLMVVSARSESSMSQFERVLEYCKISAEPPLHLPEASLPPKWPTGGNITFRDVKMKYREDGDDVLKGLSFSIFSGEKIGVIGRTGAGKSSLLNALVRIFEILPEGEILVDGVDIRSIGVHDLRHNVAIIPQEPVLFSDTVRKNLDPFGNHTNEELWAVLQEVSLQEAVRELEGGLDCEVGLKGSRFSSGQRQLICIARALLLDVPIVLLDEATSSVDGRTDAIVQNCVRGERLKERTVITIAHRLSTVIDSTKLLVMNSGVVEAFGPAAELLGIVGDSHDKKSSLSPTLAEFVKQSGAESEALRVAALDAFQRDHGKKKK